MTCEIVEIKHTQSGTSVQMYKYGATVVSFKTRKKEILFVSRDAKLDGSKAIRGGIPLVFPQFGQPDPSFPQHGFLRNNTWELLPDSKFDSETQAGCDFVLTLDKAVHGRGTFPESQHWGIGQTELNCKVTLKVRLSENKLTTCMEILNTSSKSSFEFQCLFHAYYNVANHAAMDKHQCYVDGLQGYQVIDKITKQEPYTNQNIVAIDNLNVDRVYNPVDHKDQVHVTIGTGNDTKVTLEASGTVNGAVVPVSAVVWNPYKVKAEQMSDFGSDQYVDMICVEPGLLADVPPLAPNQVATLTQTICAE